MRLTSSQTQQQPLAYVPISNLTTGSELVHHANRIGVSLRSTSLLKHPLPSARSRPQSTNIKANERNKKETILPLSTWDRHHSNIPMLTNNADISDYAYSVKVCSASQLPLCSWLLTDHYFLYQRTWFAKLVSRIFLKIYRCLKTCVSWRYMCLIFSMVEMKMRVFDCRKPTTR